MIAAVAAVLVPSVPAAARTRTLFVVDDPRIDEASGLGVGLRSPGVLYVQNDSGDTNRFFALDARTGRTAATVEVTGARNVDWEDLAVADDRAGTPSVWLADIGDNDGERNEVDVYRVDEPRIAPGDQDRRITTARADVWRLRYSDGFTDAESLAVTPGGVAYLVTKSFFGQSSVYRLPAGPDARRVQTLTRIADIAFSPTGTPGGPDPIGQLTATGASFSRDGTVFVVRTYTDAYLWRVAGGDLTAALRRRPVRVALPPQRQGEGIAVDGSRLLVDSEGVGQPVCSVPVPRLPVVPTPAAPAAPATPSPSGPATATAAQGDDDGPAGLLVGAAVAVVAAVLVGAVALAAARRWRRSRDHPHGRMAA